MDIVERVGQKRAHEQDEPCKRARVDGEPPVPDMEDLVDTPPVPSYTCVHLMCHAMVYQDANKIKRDKIVPPTFRRKHNEAHRFHNTLLRLATYTQGEKLAFLTSNSASAGYCVELCLLYHDDALPQCGVPGTDLERQDKCPHEQCMHMEVRLHRAAHTTKNDKDATLEHTETDQRALPREVRAEVDAVRDTMRALLNSPFLQAAK